MILNLVGSASSTFFGTRSSVAPFYLKMRTPRKGGSAAVASFIRVPKRTA
jgi:hypothetical protein